MEPPHAAFNSTATANVNFADGNGDRNDDRDDGGDDAEDDDDGGDGERLMHLLQDAKVAAPMLRQTTAWS